MPPATKRSKKKATDSSSKTKSHGQKSSHSILGSLSESIENLGFIQQISNILSELEDRANDVKEEASKEIKKVMKAYDGKYKDIDKKINKITKEAKQKAEIGLMTLVSKWHEHKEKLPEGIAQEVENLVGQGLKAIKAKTKKATAKKQTPTQKKTVKKKAAATKKTASAEKATASKKKKASSAKKAQEPKTEGKTVGQ